MSAPIAHGPEGPPTDVDQDFYNAAAFLLYAEVIKQHGLAAVPFEGESNKPDAQKGATSASAAASSEGSASSLSSALKLPAPRPGPGEPHLAAAARELSVALGELNALVNTLNLTKAAGAPPPPNAPPPLFEHTPINKRTPPSEWFARQAAIARGHKALALREASQSLLVASERIQASLPGQSRFLDDLQSMSADGWGIVTAARAQAIADEAAAALPRAGAAGAAPRLPAVPHVLCLLPFTLSERPHAVAGQDRVAGHDSALSFDVTGYFLSRFGHRILAPIQIRASSSAASVKEDTASSSLADDVDEAEADDEMLGSASESLSSKSSRVRSRRRQRKHVIVHIPPGFLPVSLRVTMTSVSDSSSASASSAEDQVEAPLTASVIVDVTAAAASDNSSPLSDPTLWSVAASAAAEFAWDLLTSAAVATIAQARGPPVTQFSPLTEETGASSAMLALLTPVQLPSSGEPPTLSPAEAKAAFDSSGLPYDLSGIDAPLFAPQPPLVSSNDKQIEPVGRTVVVSTPAAAPSGSSSVSSVEGQQLQQQRLFYPFPAVYHSFDPLPTQLQLGNTGNTHTSASDSSSAASSSSSPCVGGCCPLRITPSCVSLQLTSRHSLAISLCHEHQPALLSATAEADGGLVVSRPARAAASASSIGASQSSAAAAAQKEEDAEVERLVAAARGVAALLARATVSAAARPSQVNGSSTATGVSAAPSATETLWSWCSPGPFASHWVHTLAAAARTAAGRLLR